MKISFDEIPEEGLNFDINDRFWLTNTDFKVLSDPLARITLKKIESRVVMRGFITCSVELECDRCLSSFESKLESDFTLFFDWVGVGKNLHNEDEHQLTDAEMDIVELEDPEIDLFETLQQQYYLMLPVKTICNEKCKGLCSHCGIDKNQSLCSCSELYKDSPFSELTKIKIH
nr:DUF177 domain-containing protein [Desulfobulbaceae bacterium]